LRQIFKTSDLKMIQINTDTFDNFKQELLKLIPYVHISFGALGKDSMFIFASFDPKEKWANGIRQNSNHFHMVIYQNGTMEVFSQSIYKGSCSYENRIKTKFRKTKAKDNADALKKLSTFITKVKEELNAQ
jgi:TPP-dependent trihydroxycyclohexane-1,2-dione (THcHDO) dehydratase